MKYRIKLSNCCYEPKIEMEFNFDADYYDEVLYTAKQGFREVTVTNAETGELIYSQYVSDEHFVVEDYTNIGECIIDLCRYTIHRGGF